MLVTLQSDLVWMVDYLIIPRVSPWMILDKLHHNNLEEEKYVPIIHTDPQCCLWPHNPIYIVREMVPRTPEV